MTIVTITSDLRSNGFPLAALKGSILTQCAGEAQLTDISNEIKPFNIIEGAFVLSGAWDSFPPGTIHLVHINPFYSKNYTLLVHSHREQHFIAPNNGFLPLLFENELPGQLPSFSDYSNSRDLYMLYGKLIGEIGKDALDRSKLHTVYQKIGLKPVISTQSMRGSVIHIDNFGNLYTNIRKEQFDKARAGRDFAVYFRYKDPITSLSGHYHHVSVGEELCRFNSAGFLEIAVNLGNAHQILDINMDDVIQIDFIE